MEKEVRHSLPACRRQRAAQRYPWREQMKFKTLTALTIAACLAAAPVFGASAAAPPDETPPAVSREAENRADDEMAVLTVFPAYPADGMTVEELLDFLEVAGDGAWVQADLDDEYGVAGDKLVCTGMVLNEEAYEQGQCYIVIQGDVIGNGRIGLAQLVRLARAVTGQSPLEGVFEIAGDLNESGRIDLSDLVMLAQLYVEATQAPPEITQEQLDEASRQLAQDLCQARREAGFPLTEPSSISMEAASEYLAMYYLNHDDPEKVREEWRNIAERLMPGPYHDAAVAGGSIGEADSLEDAMESVLTDENVLGIVQRQLSAPVKGIGASLYLDTENGWWWYAVVVEMGY